MNKKEAKEEIKKIVVKYERLTSGEKRAYNEAMTRKDFILPLFHILGWDVYNDSIPNEVKEEESAVKGTVDYSFRTNNIPQFLLEAKAIKVDLDRIEWARQAVSYGWNMGIEWVILTDFEDIKLFNASWKIDTPRPNLELNYKEYLDRFDDLWLFSKESFEKGELDKQAGKWSIGAKRVEVTEKLANDLIEWRKQLFDNFHQWNTDKSEKEIDEAVQRILDRFIFMRSCEDKKIESPILWQNFQKWNQDMKERNFLKILRPVFKEFDENYNSNLFKEHLCDNLETEGDPFLKVISGLYGDKEAGVKYNFAAIKPDVLGKVYEQYLGHLLQKAGKRGEDLGKTKRKKQGIYYTPTFIVDYIVQNTLGPVLDNCKTVHDLKKIKVLDPACGSGSFLIKALEMINEKYKKFGAPGNTYTKIQILMENIYGVDLDEQAVEITRLNLLLNALEKRLRFPLLANIKNGNSLISGTDDELSEYFGKNFRDRKSFNWGEEFPEVFGQGGFDVIIGNPPYVTTKYGKITESLKKFYIKNFESAYDKLDLYVLFIEKAIKISKERGFVGFITPWNFLANFYSFKIRKFLLDNTRIKLLNKLPPNVFGGVIVDNIISIFEKDKNNKGNSILFDDIFDKSNRKHLNQDIYLQNEKYVFTFPGNNVANQILTKMKINSVGLGKIALNYIGIMTGGQREMIANSPIFKNSKPVLSGKDIARWVYFDRGNFVNFDKSKIHSNDNEEVYLSKKKILLRKTGRELVACIDENQFFTIQSLYNIVVRDKDYKEEYLLSLLNSKLFTYIYNKFFITNPQVFPYIKRRHLDQLSIKAASYVQQKPFIELVGKINELNKEIKKTSKNSEKWDSIKLEIEKIDKKIDQLVYKLYNLTSEEIKTVEDN